MILFEKQSQGAKSSASGRRPTTMSTPSNVPSTHSSYHPNPVARVPSVASSVPSYTPSGPYVAQEPPRQQRAHTQSFQSTSTSTSTFATGGFILNVFNTNTANVSCRFSLLPADWLAVD
jgi:hypothetical protein